jgi:multidrug efflux system membrane fusion protein
MAAVAALAAARHRQIGSARDITRSGMVGMSKRSIRSGLLGTMALACVLGIYWHYAGTGAHTPAPADKTVPVRVSTVERRRMAVVEHTVGTIVAAATVQVTARVEGTLESAAFKEGSFVQRGDLLFQIDPRPFQAAVDQASATLQRDQALLENARRDLGRYQDLYRRHTISAQLHDTSSTNVAVLAATVAADKATLELARINLGYTRIRSPIDGKTGPLLVQPGNMVAAASGTPLVTIAQIQPVKLSFNLPQSDLPRIHARLESHPILAEIDLPGAHGAALSAPVDFTSNAVSSQSGTVELRANFGNADFSLLPGELVNVRVTLDDIPDALVVPHDAINEGPDGPYVYQVQDGRAVQRDIKVLFDDSRNVAVSGDLRPGEQVIVEGQLRVTPGARVHIFAADDGARPSAPGGAGTGQPQ